VGVGTDPVPDDVQGEARQKLLAYLLALALARPTRGDRMAFLDRIAARNRPDIEGMAAKLQRDAGFLVRKPEPKWKEPKSAEPPPASRAMSSKHDRDSQVLPGQRIGNRTNLSLCLQLRGKGWSGVENSERLLQVLSRRPNSPS
jgi:hypothetical protein